MHIARKLRALLDSVKTERPVLAWLKKHPLILAGLMSETVYVAAEFPFGTDFRADFVALHPFSGGWNIHFIELEAPNAPLFTRSGKPARQLVSAISQIDSWKTFVDKNRADVLRGLSKFLKDRELVYERRDYEPVDSVGWPLYHPESVLIWHYKIVAGRSDALSEKDIGKKAAFQKHHDVELITYDRLIRVAQQYDSGQMPDWKEGRRV